jgi:D-beta-D-heptose 7-phosphate kinase/D-beta-D-heptose 1-phosphate adenosyltransferase
MFELPMFEKGNVLVIGDVMLDCYWKGRASRISPEAPVPVLNIANMDRRLGGAANVALNIQALGANVHLMGMIGDDDEGRAFENCLLSSGLSSDIVTVEGGTTITKLRVISQNQQLIRLDFEGSYQDECKKELINRYEALLNKIDVVVISDYAKGTLTQLPTLISLAREHKKIILVDPKGEDFSKYQGATLLTPNLSEFESIVGLCENDDIFEAKGQAYLNQQGWDALLVTRGAKGMTLFQRHLPPYHLKAQAKEVFDVTGAGDTVIGVLSACLAAGMLLSESVGLSNHAAGIVVGRLGASNVSAADLYGVLDERQVLNFAMLKKIIKQHQKMKESVELIEFNGEEISIYTLQHWMQLKDRGVFLYLVLREDKEQIYLNAVQDVCRAISLIDNVSVVTEEEGLNLHTLNDKPQAERSV